MIPISVFASNRGGNFEAIQKAILQGKLNAKIVALVCDRPGAPVLEKAEKLDVPTLLIPFQNGLTREEHEKEIVRQLKPFQPQFLVLGGYMRLMTDFLIEEFRSKNGYTRIVNIHPSLLPSFPGQNAYAQAFNYGVKTTGVTVHLVEKAMDSGPICAQESFDIADCRSAEEIEKKGTVIEHRLYPETLNWVLAEKFEMQRGRVCVRKN
jgi:phosphoribosylglycinamide formyltransferase-1